MLSRGSAASFACRYLTWGSGLVLLALLLQALSLFHSAEYFAARLVASDASIEICTPLGLIRIDVETGEENGGTLSVQPCSYCSTTQISALPPPSWAPPIFLARAKAVFPPRANRTLQAPDQRHAPPRGPPFFL